MFPQPLSRTMVIPNLKISPSFFYHAGHVSDKADLFQERIMFFGLVVAKKHPLEDWGRIIIVFFADVSAHHN